FDKGISFKMGQTHVHAFLPELLPLIEQGLLTPEEIVTHYLPLEDAARGYKIFEKREEECRKVILVPGAATPEAARGIFQRQIVRDYLFRRQQALLDKR
nr:hypothetical protein [Cronobacter malonaticus]